jgi:hypothetical protein
MQSVLPFNYLLDQHAHTRTLRRDAVSSAALSILWTTLSLRASFTSLISAAWEMWQGASCVTNQSVLMLKVDVEAGTFPQTSYVPRFEAVNWGDMELYCYPRRV